MRLLRRMKAEAALLIALADIGGVWPVMRVDARADRACRHRGRRRGALSAARRPARAAGSRRAIRRSRETGSGYIVLAMGKMGAFELNYSSDIDLIVFFDPDGAGACRQDAEPRAVLRAR